MFGNIPNLTEPQVPGGVVDRGVVQEPVGELIGKSSSNIVSKRGGEAFTKDETSTSSASCCGLFWLGDPLGETVCFCNFVFPPTHRVFIAYQVRPRSRELATGNSLGSESGLRPRGKEGSESSSFRCRTNASHGDSEDSCPHHHFGSDRT
jgi:hypothetical protein